MIFVTVGTHEQPFNRLVKYMDGLKEKDIVKEEIFIQTGFCTFEPQYCQWSKLLTYQEMIKKTKEARIVITHGGPSSFIMPLQFGKIPIVVPRQKKFGEHVNDHQMEFCKAVEERKKNIIVVENIQDLKDCLLNYDDIAASVSVGVDSNNTKFIEKFEELVTEFEIQK